MVDDRGHRREKECRTGDEEAAAKHVNEAVRHLYAQYVRFVEVLVQRRHSVRVMRRERERNVRRRF